MYNIAVLHINALHVIWINNRLLYMGRTDKRSVPKCPIHCTLLKWKFLCAKNCLTSQFLSELQVNLGSASWPKGRRSITYLHMQCLVQTLATEVSSNKLHCSTTQFHVTSSKNFL